MNLRYLKNDHDLAVQDSVTDKALQDAFRRCSPSSLIPSQRRERSILNGLSAAQKSPRLAPGALFSSRIRCLSPYRNAGLSNRRAKLIHANALGGGRDYQFHPDGIRTLEIRSLGRLAQGVDAVLLLPGGRVGETGQLEHDP